MAKQTRSQRRLKTNAPQLSEATIARIRADAHRYVLAGGGIFPNADEDHTRGEHIANVRELLAPGIGDQFENSLTTRVPDYQPHEELWSAGWNLSGAAADAGFLFGVFVGLDLAAMTLGQPVAVHPVRGKTRGGR